MLQKIVYTYSFENEFFFFENEFFLIALRICFIKQLISVRDILLGCRCFVVIVAFARFKQSIVLLFFF